MWAEPILCGEYVCRFAPPGGAVFVEDFASPVALAAHLVALDKVIYIYIYIYI